MSYYIISLKHTGKTDDFMTLWGTDNSGHYYSKERADVYESIKDGYHNGEGDLPISEDVANGMFLRLEQDGKTLERIPNCKPIWDALGVKWTKGRLGSLVRKETNP